MGSDVQIPILWASEGAVDAGRHDPMRWSAYELRKSRAGELVAHAAHTKSGAYPPIIASELSPALDVLRRSQVTSSQEERGVVKRRRRQRLRDRAPELFPSQTHPDNNLVFFCINNNSSPS
ncbi:hypothetical protein E4T47_00890 [Aureobasidium subglaciale]|nr:hypothetical protein E4T43_00478 [Aureobasidium subglaciale]KAI5276257.1 hypothetical protein E4T47_00890 [Aureobasidium subglaciale]